MEFFLRKVYPWLIDISSLSPALPFIFGIFLLSGSRNRQLTLLLLFLFFAVAVEAVALVTVRLGTTNNLWLWHVYTPLEFCAVAAIFYSGFRMRLLKNFILIVAIAFVLFCIFDSVFLSGITQMNSIAQMVENVLLILLAVLYFYKVSNDLRITYLEHDSMFLFSCGLLIYKAGSSMALVMFNRALAESYDAARMCLAIIFILKILFFIGLVPVLKRASVK